MIHSEENRPDVSGGPESVLIVIDCPNLYKLVSSIYGDARIDYAKLVAVVAAGRLVTGVRLYVAEPTDAQNDYKRFLKAMRHLGYAVNTLKPKQFLYSPDLRKCNHDIPITIDLMDMLYQNTLPDTVILISGDYDFFPLIERLKSAQVKTEVVSTYYGLATELKSAASAYRFIQDMWPSIQLA